MDVPGLGVELRRGSELDLNSLVTTRIADKAPSTCNLRTDHAISGSHATIDEHIDRTRCGSRTQVARSKEQRRIVTAGGILRHLASGVGARTTAQGLLVALFRSYLK